MTADPVWPEDPERVRSRVRGIVDSLLRPDELVDVHLEVVTTEAPLRSGGGAARPALHVTVQAVRSEVFHDEIWGAGWDGDWEDTLAQLASSLEDWVCESSFGWGQQRVAIIPE